MREQERILKSLSDRKNQETTQPSPKRDSREESEQRQQANDKPEGSDTQRSNKNKIYNEAELGNVSDQQEIKKQKVELEGEFRKIKPPTFDGEVEEVAEAWIINMNKYFQFYEYNSKLKAFLAIYQQREKATLWWEEVKNMRGIEDQNVTSDEFQQYFKDKYLTE